MVKKSLHLTPGIEPLYGTRDENLRLMEDGLDVQIDLRSDTIQMMGEAIAVARVEGIFQDFEHLRRVGVHPHNGELNALLKMVISDPTVTLRGGGMVDMVANVNKTWGRVAGTDGAGTLTTSAGFMRSTPRAPAEHTAQS